MMMTTLFPIQWVTESQLGMMTQLDCDVRKLSWYGVQLIAGLLDCGDPGIWPFVYICLYLILLTLTGPYKGPVLSNLSIFYYRTSTKHNICYLCSVPHASLVKDPL
jgi:hypothetical protein